MAGSPTGATMTDSHGNPWVHLHDDEDLSAPVHTTAFYSYAWSQVGHMTDAGLSTLQEVINRADMQRPWPSSWWAHESSRGGGSYW